VRSGATGLRAWVVQRISALYLALFFLYLIAHFACAAPADVGAWRAWVGQPAVSVGGYLFFLALALHAWVGVRDVLIDYVHPPAARLGLLLLIGFGLLACSLWALQLIVRAGMA